MICGGAASGGASHREPVDGRGGVCDPDRVLDRASAGVQWEAVEEPQRGCGTCLLETETHLECGCERSEPPLWVSSVPNKIPLSKRRPAFETSLTQSGGSLRNRTPDLGKNIFYFFHSPPPLTNIPFLWYTITMFFFHGSIGIKAVEPAIKGSVLFPFIGTRRKRGKWSEPLLKKNSYVMIFYFNRRNLMAQSQMLKADPQSLTLRELGQHAGISPFGVSQSIYRFGQKTSKHS